MSPQCRAALRKSSAGSWDRATSASSTGCLTGEALPAHLLGALPVPATLLELCQATAREEEGAGPFLGAQPNAGAQVALLGHLHGVSPISQG